jgi:hypothetical protein
MGWSSKALGEKVRKFNKEYKKGLKVRRVNDETQVLNAYDTILLRGTNRVVAEKLDAVLEATKKGLPAVQAS